MIANQILAKSNKYSCNWLQLIGAVLLLASTAGCQPPNSAKSNVDTNKNSQNNNQEKKGTDGKTAGNLEQGNVIVSDGPITVENGKVTFGKPEVTESVEKEIYKSLVFRLNMAEQIEKRNPGGNSASRNMRQEHQTIKQSFMTRYELSESDIHGIMEKGEKEGWSRR